MRGVGGGELRVRARERMGWVVRWSDVGVAVVQGAEVVARLMWRQGAEVEEAVWAMGEVVFWLGGRGGAV